MGTNVWESLFKQLQRVRERVLWAERSASVEELRDGGIERLNERGGHLLVFVVPDLLSSYLILSVIHHFGERSAHFIGEALATQGG